MTAFGKRQGSKYRFASDEAEKLCEQNAGKDTDAVNSDIPYGWPASGYKGLVIFIQPGKGNAEYTGQKKKPQTADAVDIEGKGYSDSQNEIFGYMSQFSNIIVDLICINQNLRSSQFPVQEPVCQFYKLYADFVAESCRSSSILRRKGKNHVHDCQCRQEGKRLQQETKRLFDK